MIHREENLTFPELRNILAGSLKYVVSYYSNCCKIQARTFRNKKREYLKSKINELESNNKNKNTRDLYRDMNEFKKGYQPRINIIKDENGNLLVDFHSVLNRWKNFFNQVLNLHGVHDVRLMDIHMAEPLVPEPSLVEVEIAIGKLKMYKSPGTDEILSELLKAGG
jgi:hypothetical protein